MKSLSTESINTPSIERDPFIYSVFRAIHPSSVICLSDFGMTPPPEDWVKDRGYGDWEPTRNPLSRRDCHLRGGAELWRTDGTERGTTRVDDLRPGLSGASPEYLTIFNGALYYAAKTDAHGTELWRSTGERGGARLVEDIRYG